MATKITLRRLTKVINRLERLRDETSSEATDKLMHRANIYDDPTAIYDEIDAVRLLWNAAVARYKLLVHLRRTLRDLVNEANISSGITPMVSELHHINLQLQFVRSLLRQAPNEYSPDIDSITSRVEGACAQAEAGNRFGTSDSSISFSIIEGKAVLDELETEVHKLEKRRDMLTDHIERINVTVQVDLSDGVERQLSEFNLL